VRRPINARNVIAMAALSMVAAGSWYVARSLQPTEVTRTVSSSNIEEFYLRSARILGTDENGNLLYSIEAEYAEQRKNQEIELQNVRISYSPDAEVPWTINADTATLSDDHSLLRLSGHVIAVSNEGFSGEVTEIRAPLLNIEPDNFRAETDSRVQIRIGARSLTATGMLALLQDNRLHLKSNVSGKFAP
jgi:LPS export ABC transporter protein LptC